MIRARWTSAAMAVVLCAASGAQATIYDFDDELTSPPLPAPATLDTSLWTLNYPTGYFSYHVTSDSLTLNKTVIRDYSNAYAAVDFNMAAAGGPLTHDFSISVDFGGTSLGLNHFVFNLLTSEGSIGIKGYQSSSTLYFDALKPDGTATTNLSSGIIAGTLQIVRINDTTTFSVNGNTFASLSGYEADITGAQLILQSYGTNDYAIVTFSDFTINAVPEAASVSILMMAGAGLLLRRRK